MARETTRAAVTQQVDHGHYCGVARAAALLGDVWTLLLLRDLAHGPRRFSELETSTGVSPRVLTERLRDLTAQGLLTRQVFNEIPPRVEYSLTEKGTATLPVIDALRGYGERWLAGDTTCAKAGPGRSAAAVASN